ncbi:glutaredoxin-like protein NrdH [Cryobacterium luteum]|nr:glutaredoxin-like protein NrdH [Cryobacterium luteum]
MVTVYSKPACIQCTMTYRALDKAGVTYTVVDVTENAAALEYVSEDLGYSSAPIVVVDEHNHWAGFRPDRIAALAQGRALEG